MMRLYEPDKTVRSPPFDEARHWVRTRVDGHHVGIRATTLGVIALPGFVHAMTPAGVFVSIGPWEAVPELGNRSRR